MMFNHSPGPATVVALGTMIRGPHYWAFDPLCGCGSDEVMARPGRAIVFD